MHTCVSCYGKRTSKLVKRMQEYDGCWYKIENLLAMVCQQCDEVFYEPSAPDLVIELITSGEAPIRDASVAVFDAS